MAEDKTTKKLMDGISPISEREESDEVKLMNYPLYKNTHQVHTNFLKRLVRMMSVEVLIKELKRRKVIEFDYQNDKWIQKEEAKDE